MESESCREFNTLNIVYIQKTNLLFLLLTTCCFNCCTTQTDSHLRLEQSKNHGFLAETQCLTKSTEATFMINCQATDDEQGRRSQRVVTPVCCNTIELWMSASFCLDVVSDGWVQFQPCDRSRNSQNWFYSSDTKRLRNYHDMRCMEKLPSHMLQMRECDTLNANAYQRFILPSNPDFAKLSSHNVSCILCSFFRDIAIFFAHFLLLSNA